ncbi:MAG: UbiA family prenyltransferase [Chloroflexi bacterium]|nr:UbiA family prenyltransferase [Chloroflexota bacterium]
MPTTMSNRVTALIQLSRWQEHVPFVIPLTLMGALLALKALANGQGVDLRLLAVMAANVLVVAYAFMINDIEDAPDDALDPDRAKRNPVTSGLISVRAGYTACRVVAALTMLLYAFGGAWPFIIGGLTLLLSHLYSWKPIRLKAWPVTDIVSHSLMLSGLLMLAGYFTYHNAPGLAWFVVAGVTLWSVYGQLYNQLRDYEMDKAAGLKNTSIILGESNTRIAIWITIGLGIGSLLIAIVQNLFPVWLGAVAIVAILASMLVRPKGDMRGSTVDVAGAAMQIRGLIVFNAIMLAWLVVAVITQITG